MAIKLEPGELTVRLHRGTDLKDCDWFGQQDPYVVLRCGKSKYRSNTHKEGGRNPVWGHVFIFKLDQETELEFEVWDEDVGMMDDFIGRGSTELVSVRSGAAGQQHDVQVPLFRRISKRQQGFLHLTLSFRPSVKPSSPTAATAGGLLGQPPSLAAGRVPAGGLPDTVPQYEPTCGPTELQPSQRLPCQQGPGGPSASSFPAPSPSPPLLAATRGGPHSAASAPAAAAPYSMSPGHAHGSNPYGSSPYGSNPGPAWGGYPAPPPAQQQQQSAYHQQPYGAQYPAPPYGAPAPPHTAQYYAPYTQAGPYAAGAQSAPIPQYYGPPPPAVYGPPPAHAYAGYPSYAP